MRTAARWVCTAVLVVLAVDFAALTAAVRMLGDDS